MKKMAIVVLVLLTTVIISGCTSAPEPKFLKGDVVYLKDSGKYLVITGYDPASDKYILTASPSCLETDLSREALEYGAEIADIGNLPDTILGEIENCGFNIKK